MSTFIIRVLSRLRRKRAKAKARQEKASPVDTSSSKPPSDSSLPSTTVLRGRQGYYELARRLRPLLPPACNYLEPDDISILDKGPFSSGSFSEVWRGSLQGLPIAMKSLRLYSSPEFNPAEVGIVSGRPSALLKQY